MVDYRGRYKANLDAGRSQIEARKAELREQGFFPGDRGRYRDSEGNDFTDQELVNLGNNAQDLQEMLQREEARFSQFETTSVEHEQSVSDSSPELVYLDDSQALPVDYGFQIEQFGDLLWSKLHRKALIAMGFCLANEFIDTSNEGKIGAVVGGGVGVAGSLMNDGQIDSLEAVAIGGLFWLGMKVGEAFTPIETFLENGQKSYDERDYNSAIANFSKAISKDKHCTLGFYARGCSYMNLRVFDRAVYDFTQVIALDSTHNEAYQKRADILYSQADYRSAIKDYTTLFQLGIHSGENYFKRGMAFAAINRVEDALADFNCAIEVCSIYSLSYLARGNIYLLKGKLDAALQDFNQAIKLNIDYPEGYLGRARVCHALKKYQNAISDYSKALRLSRGSSNRDIRRSAYHGRSLSYLALKQPWKARWDSLRAGVPVKELRFTQQEVIYAATPVLAASALFAVMPLMVRIALKPQSQTVSALASKSDVKFDGGSFSGESSNGKANGKGVWTHSNGSKLEGEFRENVLITGQGVLHDGNSRYEGSFANGKKNGQGILKFADGTVYEGNFKDGEPNGEGVTIFLDRTQYKGEHRGNQFHGKGVLTLPTGEIWKGGFANGKLSGRVTKTSSAGGVEEQVCVNGNCTPIPVVSSKGSTNTTSISNQSNSKR